MSPESRGGRIRALDSTEQSLNLYQPALVRC
jgi:hypothetical protein